MTGASSAATARELFEGLLDKPFWMWDQKQQRLEDIRGRGDCCFNPTLFISIYVYNSPKSNEKNIV
jgi:hypothetical protein